MNIVDCSAATERVDADLVEWICDFIESQQASSGALLSVEFHAETGGRGEEASVVFPTALGMRALQGVNSARTREIVMRGKRFLDHARGGAQLWRHWSCDDPRWHFIPFDVDDTAVALQTAPNVEARSTLIEHCVGSIERFSEIRTWIAGESEGFTSFYQTTEAALDDHDLCVVANAVASLGAIAELMPALRALDQIESLGAPIDKWYLDWPMRAYCLAHALSSAPIQLAKLRRRLPRLIEQASGEDSDGSLLAAAARVVVDVAVGSPRARLMTHVRALRDMCASPDKGQLFFGIPIYFGGPKRAAWWESPGMVACVVLEALARAGRVVTS